MDEHTDVTAEVLFLAALSQELFLSPSCAAGKHGECWQVDRYSGRTCCCHECDHVDLKGAPPPAILPLLHLAEEGRRRVGYTYNDRPLGVRNDLYRAVDKALRLHVPELRRPRIAHDVAMNAALALYPRTGA